MTFYQSLIEPASSHCYGRTRNTYLKKDLGTKGVKGEDLNKTLISSHQIEGFGRGLKPAVLAASKGGVAPSPHLPKSPSPQVFLSRILQGLTELFEKRTHPKAFPKHICWN